MPERHPGLNWSAAEPELEDHEPGFQPDGSPTLATLANAIQCWALLQGHRRVLVSEAALAFCIPEARVLAALDWHPFLLVSGDGAAKAIEHEGE